MIKIEKLNKKYNRVAKRPRGYIISEDDEIIALDSLDCEIGKGLTLIVGENGCGKSTLLNMIGKIDKPDNGSITVDGLDILSLSGKAEDEHRRNKVAYIFQEKNLIESMTVKENLMMVGADKGLSEEDIILGLEKLGMSDYINAFPNKMSLGQQQRIAIFRAMVKDCDIILADEPTASLDPEMARIVADLLSSISREKTVIVVTHDLDSFSNIDRKLTMQEGKIIQDELCEHTPVEDKEINAVCVKKNTNKKNSLEKYCFKVGVKTSLRRLKKHWLATFIQCLMLTVVLFSIGLFMSKPIRDESTLTSELFVKDNFNYVLFESKQVFSNYNEGNVLYEEIIFPIPVDEYYSIATYTVKYTDNNNDFSGSGYSNNDPNEPLYYPTRMSNKIVKQSMASNEDLVLGNRANNVGEILITDYLADYYMFYGYENQTFASYQDIIDNAVFTLKSTRNDEEHQDRQVKVSGIIKTDKDKFDHIKDMKLADIFNKEELNCQNTIYQIAIINQTQSDYKYFASKKDMQYSLIYVHDTFSDWAFENPTDSVVYLRVNDAKQLKEILSAHDNMADRDRYRSAISTISDYAVNYYSSNSEGLGIFVSVITPIILLLTFLYVARQVSFNIQKSKRDYAIMRSLGIQPHNMGIISAIGEGIVTLISFVTSSIILYSVLGHIHNKLTGFNRNIQVLVFNGWSVLVMIASVVIFIGIFTAINIGKIKRKTPIQTLKE